ncbi:hypothetical protein [Hominenteromicrobium sp.]|uniref:hypothetical protein n=1 Tax=Hominenteromicrobium sp. TaxID=3073581 RepID=UPI00399AB883
MVLGDVFHFRTSVISSVEEVEKSGIVLALSGNFFITLAVVLIVTLDSCYTKTSFNRMEKAIADYIVTITTIQIRYGVKMMPPSKFREASMMEA